MSARGTLRSIRRRTLVRFCAGLIIALVLCPFTAPFASYDPNASAISLLTLDGSLLDKACDKVVSVAASPVTDFACVHIDTLTSVFNSSTLVDLVLQRSMVHRV